MKSQFASPKARRIDISSLAMLNDDINRVADEINLT
jgi:hypothetical protein